jgi:hypothetical protein
VAYQADLIDPGEGRASLTRLWRDNLSVRGDATATLEWKYVAAPGGRGEAFVLHDGAGTAVGCTGIAVRTLEHRGVAVRAALLADFAVDRAHRTGMPALVLQRAAKRHADAAYDVAYGFPNANAVAIYRRIGYHELGGMARYVRVLRYGGYLARRYGRPIAARAAGAILDAAKLGVRLARAARTAASVELQWLDDVDPRFDRLWEESRDRWNLVCRRDAAFLRWRFLRWPGANPRVAALVERRGGALRAYAIVGGPRGDLAQVYDLFGPLDAIGDLLLLLVPALTAHGYTAASFRFLGDPRVPRLLVDEHHFALRDAQRAVIASAGAGCAIDPAIVRDPAAWYLTDLDEDA